MLTFGSRILRKRGFTNIEWREARDNSEEDGLELEVS